MDTKNSECYTYLVTLMAVLTLFPIILRIMRSIYFGGLKFFLKNVSNRSNNVIKVYHKTIISLTEP